jgi:hypothetical protein
MQLVVVADKLGLDCIESSGILLFTVLNMQTVSEA